MIREEPRLNVEALPVFMMRGIRLDMKTMKASLLRDVTWSDAFIRTA